MSLKREGWMLAIVHQHEEWRTPEWSEPWGGDKVWGVSPVAAKALIGRVDVIHP
jgi:hypothetical protein